MTPIAKNIIVVDEQGNEYEATYPKRARGLVKHGRARFIEENKICLACPPNMNLEDYSMSNDNTPALTMETLLEKIDRIVVENDYLRDGLKAIGGMEEGAEEIAPHLASIVQARETTNQQIVALYTKMYEDLRP